MRLNPISATLILAVFTLGGCGDQALGDGHTDEVHECAHFVDEDLAICTDTELDFDACDLECDADPTVIDDSTDCIHDATDCAAVKVCLADVGMSCGD